MLPLSKEEKHAYLFLELINNIKIFLHNGEAVKVKKKPKSGSL